MLNRSDYNKLHKIVFTDDYPGYKPQVMESPNGDGVIDTEKKYAHVAVKYLEQYENDYRRNILEGYLEKCHKKAVEVSERMSLPLELYPVKKYSALRILDYPPGAVTNPHKDFDLFTLMMYRDDPSKFKYIGELPASDVREINHQIHYGELLEAFGYEEASMHEVIPSDKRQRSIVYFAIPDWDVELPSGETVKEWLDERLSRSRIDKEDK